MCVSMERRLQVCDCWFDATAVLSNTSSELQPQEGQFTSNNAAVSLGWRFIETTQYQVASEVRSLYNGEKYEDITWHQASDVLHIV